MPADLVTAAFFIGRLLLGAHYLIAGIRNFLKMPALVPAMAERGAPLPKLSLIIGLTVQTIGGAMVAFGVYPAVGAIALIVFTIVATVLFHNFWAFTGAERTRHISFNLTNMALCGALLMAAAA